MTKMWRFGYRKNLLPEATGLYTPGCMDVMLDYSKEGVLLRLFYPTNEEKTNPKNSNMWPPWIPDDTYTSGLAKVLMSFTFVVRLVNWWSSGIIPVLCGAKPKLDQKLKCVVFSHGLGGFRNLYTNTCCALASRGFVVAVLEHRDHSACYTYYYKCKEDAQVDVRTAIEYQPFALGSSDHLNQRQNQVSLRAAECCRVVDFFINLNNGVVPHNVIDDVPCGQEVEFKLSDLVGNLDLESLTIMGHSFGGATALVTLSQRPDLKQGILLDPWMYPIKDFSLDQKLTQPLLFINTQTFHIASNVKAMSKFLEGNYERTMYTILHTTHEHQTDTALLIGSWLNWFMKKLNPLVALKINNSLVLEFLHKQVGVPHNIAEFRQCFEEQNANYETGLTKPWA